MSQGEVIGCSWGKAGYLFENIAGDLWKEMLKGCMTSKGFSDMSVLQKSCLVTGNSKWQHLVDNSTNKSRTTTETICYSAILQGSYNAVIFSTVIVQKMLVCCFTAEGQTPLDTYLLLKYNLCFKERPNLFFQPAVLWLLYSNNDSRFTLQTNV